MTFDFNDYMRDRLFEWVMTFGMLGIAFEIFWWPDTIGASAFKYILQAIKVDHIGYLLTIFGIIRLTTLVANGSWPSWGPRLRLICSGAAAFVWAQFCMALILLYPLVTKIPSPGIPIYFALTIGELISAYRATIDARSSSR